MATDEEKARHNARRRAAKKANDLGAEVAVIYEKPVPEWDDEELARGRPRASDGTFRGRKPKWLTPVIQDEAQRRLRQLLSYELGTYAADSLRALHKVLMNERLDDDGKPLVPASVRVDVGKYLLNQFMGTPKVSVDVHNDNPLMDLMGGILINPDGMPSHQIIVDGEVVDPSDAEDQPSHMPPMPD